jgi:hypothetical protein
LEVSVDLNQASKTKMPKTLHCGDTILIDSNTVANILIIKHIVRSKASDRQIQS